jgi:predicted GTPase
MSKELKTQLIQQCTDAVGNELDGRRPLNIAVIGTPGCGKSSFLNTIFASFKNNDRACWREIAKMGDYGEHDIQETSRLRM